MKIGFIGAGKAGFTLGRYFAENGVELSGYFSRSRQSAEEAASFAGGNVFDDAQQLVMASDAVFITTPDAAIRQTYLSLRDVDLNGKQICHCSGALCAKEAFPDIRERGGRGYSIHPLFPISSKYESYKAIGSAYFTIEGDSFDTDEWRAFFERLGNSVKILSGEHKTEYHAACAVSSNLVCALIAQSTGLLAECGFSQEQALLALKPLITANIENVLKTIRAEHIPRLIRVFQKWRAGSVDFSALRSEAFRECPGLTQIWEQPFQALYQVADGEIVVRFREKNSAVEFVTDFLKKA